MEKNICPIFIGRGLIKKINQLIELNHFSQIAVLTDKTVAGFWLKEIQQSIGRKTTDIVIPAGEREKNIEIVKYIWEQLFQAKFDRQSVVINLGGGVIGDIGGFAASCYMRGISFIQIPTSLLAQVDASVGGKVAIDFAGAKNLIGSFQQPQAVVIDTKTLLTLKKKEFVSGFAEIIKHGLIADRKYLKFVTSKNPLDFSQIELIKIIKTSCKIKARVVEADEKEEGYRRLLNFGHTIGHAIESLSLETSQPLLHGEAVAVGMIAEGKLSQMLGWLSERDFQQIVLSLKKAGLPTQIKAVSIDKILERIEKDKKRIKEQVMWTLLKSIGQAVIDVRVKEEIVRKAIRQITAI